MNAKTINANYIIFDYRFSVHTHYNKMNFERFHGYTHCWSFRHE